MGKTHSSIDTYSYKCAAGLKTLLVEYLLMQNRYMNGGIPLLTDLCLALRPDPVGMIRYLRTNGYVRLSGPSSGGIPPFNSARELNKRVG